MYRLLAFTFTVHLGVIPQLVFSSPITPNLTQRHDTVVVNFKLLGPNADCFNFSLDSTTFSAMCISVDGIPVSSSISLDHCIANDNGNMVYRFEGNFSSSCSGCTLSSNTLDLTCSKCATVAQGLQTSTINIDGTVEVNGHGVFVRDNGKLSCRAPIAT